MTRGIGRIAKAGGKEAQEFARKRKMGVASAEQRQRRRCVGMPFHRNISPSPNVTPVFRGRHKIMVLTSSLPVVARPCALRPDVLRAASSAHSLYARCGLAPDYQIWSRPGLVYRDRQFAGRRPMPTTSIVRDSSSAVLSGSRHVRVFNPTRE